jgi:KaiC/GvpD/RAD55 family RecA-like ATPase
VAVPTRKGKSKWSKLNGALEENILTLMAIDKDAGLQIIRLIPIELYGNETYRTLVTAIVRYYQKYGDAPGLGHLPDLVEKKLASESAKVPLLEDALRHIDILAGDIKREYVLDQVQEFVSEQELRLAITRGAEELERGKRQESIAALAKGIERAGNPQSDGLLARILSDEELRKLKLPRVQDAVYPILQLPGITLVTGPFGCGKTFFGIKLGMASASCSDFFNCDVEEARSVLYMDFELPTASLKERVKSVRQTFPGKIDTRLLSFWSAADSYPAPKPNLADPAQVPGLVQQCAAYDVVIVDNLSATMSGIDGNLAESYEAVQAFTMERRHAGKSTVLIQHVGKDKNKGPRGSSRQEDWVDVSLMLDKKINANGNAAVKVSCRKMRNHGESAFEPIEIELGNDAGRFSMKYRPLIEAKVDEAVEEYQRLKAAGDLVHGSQKQIADKYKIKEYEMSRAIRKPRYKNGKNTDE